jgi:glycine cleavage system H protein
MNVPEPLRYTENHHWVRREDDGSLSVGITHHAQQELGDIVFVDAPAAGRRLKRGESCGAIESVKTAADLFAPLDGEVVAVNAEIAEAPQRVNEDAYAAWLFRLRPDDAGQLAVLLDAAAYRKLAGG